MIGEGVTVVNHSISTAWDGPGDGTSPDSESPLNTVDRAVRGGILWANAAGNEGDSAWLGAFQDSDADGVHEFAAGEDCNRVVVPRGGFLYVQLRWQGEWAVRWQGERGGAAPLADLDLYLYEVVAGTYDPSSPVAASNLYQNDLSPERPGVGVPSEILFWQSPGGEYCLTVEQYSGYSYTTPQPGWVQLIDHAGNALRWTQGGGIGNPAESANPGVLAVGAASWRSPAEINDYSSRPYAGRSRETGYRGRGPRHLHHLRLGVLWNRVRLHEPSIAPCCRSCSAGGGPLVLWRMLPLIAAPDA